MLIQSLKSRGDGTICSLVHLHNLDSADVACRSGASAQVKRNLEKILWQNGRGKAILVVYRNSQRHLWWYLWTLSWKLWGLRAKKLFNTPSGTCWLVKL